MRVDLIQRIEHISGLKVDQSHDQPMVEVASSDLLSIARSLKRHNGAAFSLLLDICAVDYLSYGRVDWKTDHASSQGYQRAKAVADIPSESAHPARFALVYHLLSIKYNQRLRLKVWTNGDDSVQSVSSIWPSANWYEREAYDLFGIAFKGHPDLRRILTDYGFVGYPLRKDFPLIGETEIRYDGQQEKCVYDPVSIDHHSNVPRVIRKDHRYWEDK
jgi:NADH-quinone oxidoreductase subunit C